MNKHQQQHARSFASFRLRTKVSLCQMRVRSACSVRADYSLLMATFHCSSIWPVHGVPVWAQSFFSAQEKPNAQNTLQRCVCVCVFRNRLRDFQMNNRQIAWTAQTATAETCRRRTTHKDGKFCDFINESICETFPSSTTSTLSLAFVNRCCRNSCTTKLTPPPTGCQSNLASVVCLFGVCCVLCVCSAVRIESLTRCVCVKNSAVGFDERRKLVREARKARSNVS